MAVGTDARTPFGLQVARLRKRITFETDLDAFGRAFLGKLPANAQILATGGGVKTIFDEPFLLTVGTNGSTANNIVTAGGITEGTAGGFWVLTGAGLDITEAADVWAKMAFTTTPPTAGVVDLVVAYTHGEEREVS